MMWQNLYLFPWRNVIDNVTFGPEMMGLPREIRYQRAKELLALVGLKHFEKKLCHQLSGGMRQRVALARALIMDRPILLMDEPFACAGRPDENCNAGRAYADFRPHEENDFICHARNR